MALAARLAFLFGAEQPLLYTHQYGYFHNALRIATHPEPFRYVLTSEEWRTWDQHWTIAPLYYVVAGVVLKLSGLHLIPLRIFQCVLDAATAVLVTSLGRRVAGSLGVSAGLAYALYSPAIEMSSSWTMTENLHTPLLVGGLWLAIRSREIGSSGRTFAAGLLLGVSALARSVTSAFIPVAAAVLWLRERRPRAAVLLLAGGAVAIGPWAARNALVIGDPILIESTAFENIWFANNFADRKRFLEQEQYVHSRETPSAKRRAALAFALQGIRDHPGLFLEKIRRNFWHALRPEGLQNLLVAERSFEPWRHVLGIALDDAPFLLALALFPAFVFAGRPSSTRTLVLVWIAYYVFMIVVVFHNEIRYRSALVPFLFVGAAGGLAALQETGRRRVSARAGAVLGATLAILATARFAAPAWRLLRDDPKRPAGAHAWFDLGRDRYRQGATTEAIAAYERGVSVSTGASVRGVVALPRLLREAGRAEDADQALHRAQRWSYDIDPWLLLECAWRELPAPRTDTLVVGGDDFGAVRGFFHPRGSWPGVSAHRLEWNKYQDGGPTPPPGLHRWTRRRAWIRLVPATEAASHRITLEMGAPFPSTLRSPVVTVRVNGGPPAQFRLDEEIRPYSFVAPAGAIVVEIDSPTWNRVGEPAEQGVRVDRLTVEPAAE